MILDLMTSVTVMTSLFRGVIAVTMSPHLKMHFDTILENTPAH
ncbi:hypothetical protein ANRL1_02513 [Anaerolineae bacterium]|nr:hypothetical protein ANRL1_02513 [Anaerolineae bacterium]